MGFISSAWTVSRIITELTYNSESQYSIDNKERDPDPEVNKDLEVHMLYIHIKVQGLLQVVKNSKLTHAVHQKPVFFYVLHNQMDDTYTLFLLLSSFLSIEGGGGGDGGRLHFCLAGSKGWLNYLTSAFQNLKLEGFFCFFQEWNVAAVPFHMDHFHAHRPLFLTFILQPPQTTTKEILVAYFSLA